MIKIFGVFFVVFSLKIFYFVSVILLITNFFLSFKNKPNFLENFIPLLNKINVKNNFLNIALVIAIHFLNK